MTDTEKIKSLLDSPDEKNQRLGVDLAQNMFNWKAYDIGLHVLNSGKSWREKRVCGWTHFYKTFLGMEIKLEFDVNSNQISIVIPHHRLLYKNYDTHKGESILKYLSVRIGIQNRFKHLINPP